MRLARPALTIAAATVTMLATVAVPAHAFTGDRTDVTRDTTSKITTASPSIGVEVTRREYVVSGQQTAYQYLYEVTGIDDLEYDTCTLTVNGDVEKSGPCWSMNGFFASPMTESGTYSFGTSSNVLASWQFTLPTDTPAPLAKAKCKILKVSQAGPVSNGEMPIRVRTNNKCNDGVWSYSYSSGSLMGAGVLNTPVKGRTTVNVDDAANVNLTLAYAPNGRIADTLSTPVTLNRK